MKTFRFLLFLFVVVVGLAYGISHAGALGGLSEKSQTYTIHVIGSPTLAPVFFHGCTDLEPFGACIKFSHQGRTKYVCGSFWAEPK